MGVGTLPRVGIFTYRRIVTQMTVGRRSLLSLLGAGSLLLVTACGSDSSEPGPSETGGGGSEPPESVPEPVEEYGVDPALLAVTVFKDPSCGCCGGWVDHAESNGFSVTVEHPEVLGDVFEEHDIPADLQSCHLTLNSAGSVFVGHIPVRFVLEYLQDPPEGSRGLTVPAMPVGTPGMEMGKEFEPYDVLLLSAKGGTEVFARVSKATEQEV